jgi:hypothetical protein
MDWNLIYGILEPVTGYKNPFTEDVLRNELATRILIEADYDPSMTDDWAIQTSARKNYVTTVRLLLSDARVDPSTNDNQAIKSASERGYSEVVRLLLSDDRVDPSADDNYALDMAVTKTHIEVVRLLLNDSRIDLSNIEYIREIAYANGYKSILAMLNAATR